MEKLFKKLENDTVLMEAYYYENGEDEDYDEAVDARGYVRCELKVESEEAYRQAINFMCDIGKEEFPIRSDFRFQYPKANERIYGENMLLTYKEYNKEVDSTFVENAMFWANCFQYTNLNQLTYNYIKIAVDNFHPVEEDDRYHDSWHQPCFYAIAAHAMSDKTGDKLLDLMSLYAEVIDFYYALDTERLIVTYLDTYGITKDNSKNLFKLLHLRKGIDYEILDIYDIYLKEQGTIKRKEAIKIMVEAGNAIGMDTEELLQELNN